MVKGAVITSLMMCNSVLTLASGSKHMTKSLTVEEVSNDGPVIISRN